ncbi:MAG TPA: hypothetical protein VNQ73_15965 [Ilumatobacter sp.]|nr:hypothetical protein [Ilumatobacter sp.]
MNGNFDHVDMRLDGPAFTLIADDATFTPATMQALGEQRWVRDNVEVELVVDQTADGSRALTLRATGVRHVTEVCLLDVEVQPPPAEIYNHRWFDEAELQQTAVALVRGADGRGFFACYANPFGNLEHDATRLRLSYRPAIDVAEPMFVSDALVTGPFQATGRVMRRELLPGRDVVCGRVPGYGRRVGPLPTGLDAGEVAAIRRAVSARIPWEPARAWVSHWDWSENLYRLQIGDAETQEVFARSAQICAEMGADVYLVSPGGDYVFPDVLPTDMLGSDWGDVGDGPWQRAMWLGMGMAFGRNEWESGRELPGTIRVLDDIRARGVAPVAYVNPQYLWERDPRWAVRNEDGTLANHACFGHREVIDWLVANGQAFADHYRLGGMSWDFVAWAHCHATDHGHEPGPNSRYAQWDGYRRALRAYRVNNPGMWLETLIGSSQMMPWGAADMTHPCQAMGDNQPQWIPAWPDLSTSRVHANFQRRTAYWYRNFAFVPSWKIPGIFGHQSNRIRWWTPERGWDWEGTAFNLLSSIATGPASLCLGFVPCWDSEEWEAVRSREVAFIRRWTDWAKANATVLARLEDLFDEARPGAVDGTVALDDDGHGFMFLCNPDFTSQTVQVPLPAGRVLRELYPSDGRLWLSQVDVEPHQVHVLEVVDEASIALPALFGVTGAVGEDGAIAHAEGTPGTEATACVRTPSGDRRVTLEFASDGVSPTLGPWLDGDGNPVELIDAVGRVRVHCDWTPGAALPSLLDQLAPGVPPIGDDVLNPWSDPSRLRLFPELLDPEASPVRMWVDGEEQTVATAYVGTFAEVTDVALAPMTNNMLGHYVDLTDRLRSGAALTEPWRVELEVELQWAGQLRGVRIAHLPRRTTDSYRVGGTA